MPTAPDTEQELPQTRGCEAECHEHPTHPHPRVPQPHPTHPAPHRRLPLPAGQGKHRVGMALRAQPWMYFTFQGTECTGKYSRRVLRDRAAAPAPSPQPPQHPTTSHSIPQHPTTSHSIPQHPSHHLDRSFTSPTSQPQPNSPCPFPAPLPPLPPPRYQRSGLKFGGQAEEMEWGQG